MTDCELNIVPSTDCSGCMDKISFPIHPSIHPFLFAQNGITLGNSIISELQSSSLWGSGGGGGGGDDDGGGDGDNSPNYCPQLQKALRLLEELAPEYFDVLDSGEVTLIDEGPGLRAGGSAIGDKIHIVSHPTNPFSTAFTLYEEMFHQYQGRMLMLDAEVEAMAATAEWVQRNGLTGYLTTDSGDDFLRLYLEKGEDALRTRLKTAKGYRDTWMNMKRAGSLYPAPNPYPRR